MAQLEFERDHFETEVQHFSHKATGTNFQISKLVSREKKFISSLLVHNQKVFGLFCFYGISTTVGYLIPNPFYTYEKFYFKQFSLT